MPFLRRAQRGLAEADRAASGAYVAELGDPPVVRLEARVLVVDVGVVAQQHADRRVDDLGRDAVAVLVAEPRAPDPSRRDAARRTACRCRAGLRRSGRPAAATSQNGTSDCPLSISITSPSVSSWCRRGARSRYARIDAVEVGVGRFGDVRVGRDAQGHAESSVVCSRVMRRTTSRTGRRTRGPTGAAGSRARGRPRTRPRPATGGRTCRRPAPARCGAAPRSAASATAVFARSPACRPAARIAALDRAQARLRTPAPPIQWSRSARAPLDLLEGAQRLPLRGRAARARSSIAASKTPSTTDGEQHGDERCGVEREHV